MANTLNLFLNEAVGFIDWLDAKSVIMLATYRKIERNLILFACELFVRSPETHCLDRHFIEITVT